MHKTCKIILVKNLEAVTGTELIEAELIVQPILEQTQYQVKVKMPVMRYAAMMAEGYIYIDETAEKLNKVD